MLNRGIKIVCFFGVILFSDLRAQEKVITAGFQFRPIFSNAFFKTGSAGTEQDGVDFTISPQYSYCFGMVVRRGITPNISAESAINFTKRSYHLTITDGAFKGESDFSITGYEVPFQGLVFIKLNKFIYMDVASGISLDFFPVDLFITREISYYENKIIRRTWVLPGLLANVGWEYRTPKKGYFYFGASYHRPFAPIYRSQIGYHSSAKSDIVSIKLSGNYLTADIRYFFNEKPVKKKKKKGDAK